MCVLPVHYCVFMKLIWIICNRVWNLVGKRDIKFGGKFQIQKFETDFQRQLITPSLKIHFQRRLHCHNRPWKNIFRDGCIAAAAPCNSFSGRFMYWNRRWKRIFRGGLPTTTVPENAFSETVLLIEPPLKIPFSEAEILTEPLLEMHFQGRLKGRR